MITLSQLTEFFGWASVINLSYLVLASLVMAFMGDCLTSAHRKIFKLSVAQLETKYFGFLSQYKIATLVFFVAPYLALKLMSY
jgi:hypothetical protein